MSAYQEWDRNPAFQPQIGTLSWSKGPVLFRNNKPSMAVKAYDSAQALQAGDRA